MIDSVAAWIGREQLSREAVSPAAVAALAATLDRDRSPAVGDPLPAGWQWLFFNPVVRLSELGEDGHPRRTRDSFLPPIELPHRMWAGSRIGYLSPLNVGDEAERSSRIVRITPKEGRSGRMCFVTVEHRIGSGGRECIVEEQDIVYREAATAMSAMPPPGDSSALEATWRQVVQPDAVMLFRYSALTFNGHRIHYDLPYARDVELYRGLVVHGPLLATLLQGFAEQCQPGRRLQAFEFKGLQPLYVDHAVSLCGDMQDRDTLLLRTVTAEGRVTMQAVARFEA